MSGFNNIHNLLTLNEPNSSKNESDKFFQASQEEYYPIRK